jgi:hypothetical protein
MSFVFLMKGEILWRERIYFSSVFVVMSALYVFNLRYP